MVTMRTALLILGVILGAMAWLSTLPHALAQDAPQYRINPTGRNISMPVPFKLDGRTSLGEITIRISPSDVISFRKSAFLKLVQKSLRKNVLKDVDAAPASSGFITLGTLGGRGYKVNYDPGLVELHFYPTIDQRLVGAVSMARGARVNSANVEDPSAFSAYLNIRPVADYVSTSSSGATGWDNPRLDLEAAARFWGVALEAEFNYELDRDARRLAGDANRPFTAYGLTHHMLKRRGTRAVYDMPEQAVRIQLGDVDTQGTNLQGTPDILGLNVERSFRKLQPNQNIRPTGRKSFRIEQASTVEVRINGRTVRRLRLNAGEYDLSDLPLRTGANNIELLIRDDAGQQRSLKFSTFFDRSLLAQGVAEWGGSAGVRSTYDGNRLAYDQDHWVASGYYRRGLSDQITAEGHLQADQNVIMAGVAASLQTSFGFFSFGGALSNHQDYGSGLSASFDWSLLNVKEWDGTRSTYNFSADYYSDDFAAAGLTGKPNNPFSLTLHGSHSRALPLDVTGTLSLSYAFADADDSDPLAANRDRYSVSAGLSRALNPRVSTSISGGYTSERSSFSQAGQTKKDDGEFRAVLRLTIRPKDGSHITMDYDTRAERSHASYSKQVGRGIGQWSMLVDVDHDRDNEDSGVSGALKYVGNRFEANIIHSASAYGLGTSQFDKNAVENRTSVRLGAGLAFADGVFAFGRPVRGRGFAIVAPHRSLGDTEVTIGDPGNVRAYSDRLGPALVSGVSNYMMSRMVYDVENLPIGYDLGTGMFELFAPYQAGYALTVGSSYTVSTYGTLQDNEGKPVSLVSGEAFEDGKPKGRRVDIFTNRAGRFAAQGLAPGRWKIEMATEPPLRFSFSVPDDTVGLHRAGTLRPN